MGVLTSQLRLRGLIVLALMGTCAFAQQSDSSQNPAIAPGPNPLVTLASEFFEHDFFNVYAFGDGVLDSNNPVVTDSGTVKNQWGTGFDVGGGINAGHAFTNGQFGLSYQGAYRDYQSNSFTSGTTQNLSIGLTKRLSRHWSMGLGIGGGIFLYGGTFYTGATEIETPVVTNPFSPETKYANANLSFTYQQTRRLSYSFFGNYNIQRYNYSTAVGTNGIAGGASVNYRLTARTTLSGNYSHSYFQYQRSAGNGFSDQVGLSLAHAFRNHWTASLFGGGARSTFSGVVAVPVTLIVNNQAIGGYIIGPYKQTDIIPTFSGSVSHNFRHSVFSVSAGEGIAGGGNGYFLASRSIYANGIYSRSWNRQNISMGGTVYRLSSLANAVGVSYRSASLSASYGRNLFRFIGFFLRYDYVYYGNLSPYNGVSDNRISFGFNFSSKSIPMTLF